MPSQACDAADSDRIFDQGECHVDLLFKAAQKVAGQKRPFLDRFFDPQPAS